MANPQRAFRLSEFPAHGDTVNCLHIGRKEGRVLVTGGEDRVVNVWAIGRDDVLQSLTGMTSPVECVSFDHQEEMVVAGGTSGMLKLWNLDGGKLVRNYTGHKANATTVDFHPHGEFFASGSLDTNVKVWDVRRKGAIQTYRGHGERVSVVRFSPDGRWLVSGSDDGLVKLWDLTAGKLLHDFQAHSGGVTSVEFHPGEYMLATSGGDKTVRFWDLEQYRLTCATEPDARGVQQVTFAPEGTGLLAATGDALKVYSWEPVECLDSVNVPWQRLRDASVSMGQLLGVTSHQTHVSVWVVDLQMLRPFSGRPPTSAVAGAGHSQQPSRGDGSISARESRPRGEQPASRPATTGGCGSGSDGRNGFPVVGVDLSDASARDRPPGSGPFVVHDGAPSAALAAHFPERPLEVRGAARIGGHLPPPGPGASAPISAMGVRPAEAETPEKPRRAVGGAVSTPAPKTPGAVALERLADGPAYGAGACGSPSSAAVGGRRLVPANREHPAGLEPDSFLLKGNVMVSDEELMAMAMRKHASMCGVLSTRLTNLRGVRTFWARGDVKAAVEAMARAADPCVTVDILGLLIQKPQVFNLDICVSLLPHVHDLLGSEYEDHVLVALRAALALARGFVPIIRQSKEAVGSPSLGVDVMREERVEKCGKAERGFRALSGRVVELERCGGQVAQLAGDVRSALAGL